jgi:succinate dehydrogenase (ubiquinone) membrane anchor subunit
LFLKLLKNNLLFSTKALAQQQVVKLPKTVSLELVRKSSSNVSSASSTHWKVERILSAVLLGLIPAALVLENNILDYALAASLVLHSHWGLECIVTDYVHGPTMPKMAMGLLYVVSALTLAGLFYLNYKDIGLTKAVKKIWSL